MASLSYTLDILEISKFKLNINEYLTLLKFQHESEGRSFPFVPDERFIPRLVEDGYITTSAGIVDGIDTIHYSLGPKGIEVFQGTENLFEEFYKTFPHKVPTGTGYRPVSTLDVESASARTTKAIWDRIIKNKPYLQRTIIDNLKRELDSRNRDGSIGFLQGIDTWLRQATWEKWEDIPDTKRTSSNYKQL